MFSPYDFQENMQHRDEMVRGSIRHGSPIIAISCDTGIMLLTVRKQQRKIFEIYDRLIYSAIGKQADVEAIRLGAIDFAHQEGFQRSEADVTIQRVLGFALSPALKKAYGDPSSLPFMIRAVFAELGDTPEKDNIYLIDYSGEFSPIESPVGIAGDIETSEFMTKYLENEFSKTPTLEKAISGAFIAWGMGREKSLRKDDENITTSAAIGRLMEELETGFPEVGIMERDFTKENKFKLYTSEKLDSYVQELKAKQ